MTGILFLFEVAVEERFGEATLKGFGTDFVGVRHETVVVVCLGDCTPVGTVYTCPLHIQYYVAIANSRTRSAHKLIPTSFPLAIICFSIPSTLSAPNFCAYLSRFTAGLSVSVGSSRKGLNSRETSMGKEGVAREMALLRFW